MGQYNAIIGRLKFNFNKVYAVCCVEFTGICNELLPFHIITVHAHVFPIHPYIHSKYYLFISIIISSSSSSRGGSGSGGGGGGGSSSSSSDGSSSSSSGGGGSSSSNGDNNSSSCCSSSGSSSDSSSISSSGSKSNNIFNSREQTGVSLCLGLRKRRKCCYVRTLLQILKQ